MPPKKKRGVNNQVTFSAGKMSTRSRKQTNLNKVKNNANVVKMPKGAAKPRVNPLKGSATAGKTPIKRGPGKKKKSEVMIVEPSEDPLEINESELIEEEGSTDIEPIEQIFISSVDEEMETIEVNNLETETCNISEQLEHLNVASEPQLEDTPIEEPVLELEECEVPEPCVEDTIQDPTVQFENENYEEMAVEYITEELVPVVENTEIIIEEEEEVVNNNETSEVVPVTEEPEEEPVETIKEEHIPEPITEVEKIEEPIIVPQIIEDEPEVPVKEEIEAVEPEAPLEIKIEIKPEKPKPKKKVAKKEPKEEKKPPAKKKGKPKKEVNNDKIEEVRRSSRIKSISVLKQRSKGHGLVKIAKPQETASPEPSLLSEPEKPQDSFSVPPSTEDKPVKVKSRWRRSSELEMNVLTPANVVAETCGDSEKIAAVNTTLTEKEKAQAWDEEVKMRLKQFVHLKENLYLTDRMSCKEAKKMSCDCFLTAEEIDRGELGCGEDCLNRLLMIECGNLCPVVERCTNKKFQKCQFAPVEVFKTEKKGLGLRAAANIPYGEFILEYVGEVLDHEEFDCRADDYSKDKNRHYYFMSLRADAIIDATVKGNISRFINHSCDPNAETQKWTVNGELRIGFFSTRTILAGEEITFDYRFQRYGKEAQKCYCEASSCRGWLGEEPDEDDDEDDEEDEEEEEVEKAHKEIEELEPGLKAPSAITEQVKSAEVPVKPKKERKKRAPRKPRKDMFEDLDQLDEEIEMLVATGLKNQAHTLKLSRLMVRAKEPVQRTKLLRVLRRGELPCRRLFLDYHGLRLMHGYMTDVQELAKTDKKFDSQRLEMLQTLATLPIPNKTMLQDSKVLSTVEKWSLSKTNEIPLDSESNSPQIEQDPNRTPILDDKETIIVKDAVIETTDTEMIEKEVVSELEAVKDEEMSAIDEEVRRSVGMDFQEGVLENSSLSFTNTHGKELADEISQIFGEDMEVSPAPVEVKTEVKTEPEPEAKSEDPNYEEEITALALKLLEEWSNLKEVFKIPKKERIEQMKEHEREANRGYIAGIGLEQDAEKKSENRYRTLRRYRTLGGNMEVRKSVKMEDRNLANFPKMGKFERRRMFALQVEQKEEERRRKQREMWRQHEQHCILLGTDPRLTAPFDPNRGYQCIWNPQIGQWQNYPFQNSNLIFNPQNVASANGSYPFLQQNIHTAAMMAGGVNAMLPLPSLPYQDEIKKEEDYTQVKFMGPIPPPVHLPPKWKSGKDKYGRPFYYHIRIRKSQWDPPPFTVPQSEPDYSSETSSSSDTSSLSTDSSSEESDSDDDVDDVKLLIEVQKQMEKRAKTSFIKTLPSILKEEESDTPSPLVEEKPSEPENKMETNQAGSDDEQDPENLENSEPKVENVSKEDKPTPNRKRRSALVHEIIISPRTDEDRLQFREDVKRYKLNKEKLRREKELIVQHSKKPAKEKRHKSTIKLKMKAMNDSNSETAKKIKESFRSTMATVVVSVLNAYRKPDCKEGRITNTEDFKHLARKLTHFVMLKEMKHIEKIEDLVCTENVKTKAKEYIRKYMSKFGENYQKRHDEPDFQ